VCCSYFCSPFLFCLDFIFHSGAWPFDPLLLPRFIRNDFFQGGSGDCRLLVAGWSTHTQAIEEMTRARHQCVSLSSWADDVERGGLG
jgi:hypothetical protein